MAAVDGIDLSVPAGSVYGFLGPNGSGKTTTIRVLLGLINASAGSWRLLGEPMPDSGRPGPPRGRGHGGGPRLLPLAERPGQPGPLRRRRPRRRSAPPARHRIDDALARVGLTAAAGKRYKAYSLGMRQRLGLASVMLRPRRLLVLDEPTNGMDPQGTREIRHLIRDLADDGTTIFLSSHLLTEVEQVCTHVAVMSLGKLLAQGTIEELQAAGSSPAAGRDRAGADRRGRASAASASPMSPSTASPSPPAWTASRPEDLLPGPGRGGRRGAQPDHDPADAGGHLRGPDRGGLRCGALELATQFRRRRMIALLVVLVAVPAALALAVFLSGGPQAGQRSDLPRPGDPTTACSPPSPGSP